MEVLFFYNPVIARLDRAIYLSHNYLMSSSVAIQSSRLSQIGINRQVLKEGSSVLVRVISSRGGGKYEGSVAGVRVQLNSAKPLQPGQTFVASVGVKDGSIVISPKDSALAATAAGEIALSFNEVSEAQLFSLLESLGLPADNLSSSILKSFKQMGLKMDSALANKIRNLALRFSGKEKSAAEILSLLAQKGLAADEEEIKELLYFLEGQADRQKSERERQGKTEEKLINRINSTEGAWYLLPFELVQFAEDADSERQILGNGCIRLLFDSSTALKLLNLHCKYNNQKYLFSLAYEGRKITNTYFNVSSVQGNLSPEEEIISLKKHFMAAGINPGKICWEDSETLEGNASGLESFVSFGGRV